MNPSLLALTLIVLLFLSLWGWGRWINTFLYERAAGTNAFAVVLGLAFWCFLGGILNATGIAGIFSVRLLWTIGVISGTILIIQSLPSWIRSHVRTEADAKSRIGVRHFPLVLIVGISFCVAAFIATYLLPAHAYNFHDDYHLYMVRPVRMLQAGSMGGNPFDCLGVDSLGAHSFLQAVFLAFLTLDFFHAIDPVFCLLLGIALLFELAATLRVKVPFALLAVVLFFAIPHQCVNLSSLYSGAIMIMALLIACMKLEYLKDGKQRRSVFKQGMAVSLIAAALIPLKLTHAFFAAVFLPIYVVGLLLNSRNRKRTACLALLIVLTIAVLVAPWITLSLPFYSMTLENKFAQHETNASRFDGSLVEMEWPDFFSLKPLVGGFNLAVFHLALLFSFISGLIGFANLRPSVNKVQIRLSVVLFAGGLAVPVVYFLNVYLFGGWLGIRYTCPTLIGVLPVLAVVLNKFLGDLGIESGSKKLPNALSAGLWLMTGFQILIVFLFAGAFYTTVRRLDDYRTLVIFRLPKGYVEMHRMAVSQAFGEHVRSIQDRAPEGQTLLAWIATPFHLDYRRNDVLSVSRQGLHAPWNSLPFDGGREEFHAYLKSWGVESVMIQLNGFGVKSEQEFEAIRNNPQLMSQMAARNYFYFRPMLLELSRTSRVLYQDESFILFQLE